MIMEYNGKYDYVCLYWSSNIYIISLSIHLIEDVYTNLKVLTLASLCYML